ncbi:MAG: diacylglycerol kinase family lipid kinase [Ruminococcaceae bacterium]|nr:diacylglycerol kinase family lipid kinase [Oscillospiraceae bacterium]
MKHLFIINPAAGKYDHTGEYSQKIREACEKRCLAYEILVSRAPGDCTKIAQAAAATGDPVRIYACGGDGTLNEVVNGVAGYMNAAVTNFPCGSGNDFIKIFSDPSAFRDCGRLLDGDIATFDLIRCQRDHYSINICSMGLDARVGTNMSKYKRLPLVSGKGAYLLSTGVNVLKGIAEHYVVDIDGERFDADQTLICLSNGRWYGGGFNPTPEAEPDDGLMDVLLIKKVSRVTVAKVIGKFKAGRYAEFPQYIRHFKAKKVTIDCDKRSEINLDGELLMAKKAIFELVPQAIRFIYPKGLTYHTKKV